jgi:hypothetical protein
MAAAIVPILGAVLPQAIPLVVRLVEKLFPSKSGSQKLDAATEMAAAIQQGLQNSKALASTPLTGEQLKTSVQSVVEAMNKSGELQGLATKIETVEPYIENVADLLTTISGMLKAKK